VNKEKTNLIKFNLIKKRTITQYKRNEIVKSNVLCNGFEIAGNNGD